MTEVCQGLFVAFCSHELTRLHPDLLSIISKLSIQQLGFRDNFVDNTVFHCFFSAHPEIAIGIFLDLG